MSESLRSGRPAGPLLRFCIALAAMQLTPSAGLVSPAFSAPNAFDPAQQVADVAVGANSGAPLPKPDHVVLVIEENHAFNQMVNVGYFQTLATQGALMTQSFAVDHPSQPNYLALFSGGVQGSASTDACPAPGSPYGTANLGSQLLAAGFSFAGYSEGLPSPGSTVCYVGRYDRNHNPWSYFSNVPPSANQPFSSFPTNYASLPTVAIVVPDLVNDAHDGTLTNAAAWLQANLEAYRAWAMQNNSLLIVTADEDDGGPNNQIYTVFVGPMVKPGQYGEQITHYCVLRTLEAMYGLAPTGQAAACSPITDIWSNTTSASGPAAPATTAASSGGGSGPTGVHYPESSEFAIVRTMGYQFAIWDNLGPGDTSSLETALAQAAASSLKLIVGMWPPPYTKNSDGSWSISTGGIATLRAMAANPASVMALYVFNEPYDTDPVSSAVYNCGYYSAADLRALRSAILAVWPAAKLYYDMDDPTSWVPGSDYWKANRCVGQKYADQTAIADYVGIWNYPFTTNDGYTKASSLQSLTTQLAFVSSSMAPAQPVILGQAFASASNNLRFPAPDEMRDWACSLRKTFAGTPISWYAWRQSIYQDYLVNHPGYVPLTLGTSCR